MSVIKLYGSILKSDYTQYDVEYGGSFSFRQIDTRIWQNQGW